MDYPVETFTDAEREALAPHFTNLDRPGLRAREPAGDGEGRDVRALLALPGHPAPDVPGRVRERAAQAADAFDGEEGERARQLYERIFLGYGDDSVAQLGGAHIACEWVSNVMTKLLQRGRLAAYLEQSTRYIPYDAPIAEGLGYRYWRHPELGPEYERTMDFLFDAYAEALPRVEAWAADRFPRPDGEPEAAHRRAIRAKALDLLRGLLPAASLSHMGIFATGQAYEQLLLRLYASPLPEARDYADMILAELKAIMPSFVARVERPERGGEWISYLEERGAAAERWTRRLGLDRAAARRAGRPGRAAAVGRGRRGRAAGRAAVRGRLVLGGRGAQRRARPPAGRAGDDAGASSWASAATAATGPGAASRRCATASRWSRTTARSATSSATACSRSSGRRSGPSSGAGVPEELEHAGVADSYREGLERSSAEYERIAAAGRPELAPYALCLGYRIRYVLDMNAREAMHLIELRSGREGHPAYRAVAHALHAEIAAVHPAVAAAMSFVDRDTEPRLERILSEIRAHAKQAARA